MGKTVVSQPSQNRQRRSSNKKSCPPKPVSSSSSSSASSSSSSSLLCSLPTSSSLCDVPSSSVFVAEKDVSSLEPEQSNNRNSVSKRTHELLYREHANHYCERFRAAIDYQFKEKPRQIVCGVVLICVLVLVAFQDSLLTTSPLPQPLPATLSPLSAFSSLSSHASASNRWCGSWCSTLEDPAAFESLSSAVRRGLFAVLVTLTIYSFLQSRDGLLVRPHPGFWRVVHSIGLLHFLIMCILLVLSPDAGRMLLAVVFPEVAEYRKQTEANRLLSGEVSNNEVFAGTLELDCSVTLQTFARQLKTPWFISHVVGWLVKMCIFRDWSFCLVYSGVFELCELSFQWMVPELKECWWDSLILDYLLANIIGMLLGVVCLRLLNSCYEYDWVGQRPLYQKALLRLLPFSWSQYDWKFFNSPRRLLHAIPVLVFSNVVELNVFFFMYAFDIPASHYIHPVRCFYLCALGCAAVAEHYEYMSTRGERIGHNEWLVTLIIIVECLVSAKYGYSRFGRLLPPTDVWLPWLLALTWFTVWCVCHFWVTARSEPGKQHGVESNTNRGLENTQSLLREQKGEGEMEPKPANGTLRKVAEKILLVPPIVTFSPLLLLARYYYF